MADQINKEIEDIDNRLFLLQEITQLEADLEKKLVEYREKYGRTRAEKESLTIKIALSCTAIMVIVYALWKSKILTF